MFKILLTVYKCLHGIAPTYLSSLISYSNTGRSLRSDNKFLDIPMTKLVVTGKHAFSSAAPSLLNRLPYNINKISDQCGHF